MQESLPLKNLDSTPQTLKEVSFILKTDLAGIFCEGVCDAVESIDNMCLACKLEFEEWDKNR